MNWLHILHRPPAPRHSVICFPYAGAGPLAFRDWPQAFGAETEVLAVRLPGREIRLDEPCLEDMAAVLPPLVAELTPWMARRPVLFGHSLGAAVAHAAADALTAAGTPPRALVVSGRRAPHLPPRQPVPLPPGDDWLGRRLARLGGTPAEVLADAELMAMLLPILRADFALSERYQPQGPAPLPLPVLALTGEDDAEVAVAEVAAWQRVAGAGFTLRVLPGGHFFLNAHKRMIAEMILNLPF